MAAIDLSKLNDSQLDVVTRLDEPLFVAAGAGSGKTFTLTARLVHALSQGSGPDGGAFIDSIDEALVITFTKAAAAEIKDRVRAALRQAGDQDPHLREQSLRVDGAWISTIHGMCSRILKRYGTELGIDPDFQVLEGSVAETLLYHALDEVLDEASRDEAYQALFAEFKQWGDDEYSIVSMIRKLQDEARKCAAGYDDLVCPQSHETASLVRRLSSCVEALAAQKLTPKQSEALEPLCAAVAGLMCLPATELTPERVSEAVTNVKVPGTIRKKELKPLVEDAKEAHAETVVVAHYERVQAMAPQLVALARKVNERYEELKRRLSYLDNDDLIACALAAVEEYPEVAADLKDRFRLVMIDEFQDTDEKQLRLISLLAGENACHLTTVGDAQQAIYRFRGGDVEVFRARGRRLPDHSHVRMDVNYRSDHHVLALVERVCGDGRVLDDFLKLAGCGGRTSHYEATTESGDEPPRIFLEVATGGTSVPTSATQAAQLADRLAMLKAQGQPQGTMALLLGTTSKVSYYLDALRARGLAAVVTGGSSFSATAEVGVVQSLLHALANPHDTEAGLFRLLSSDMFRLDADDFCQLGTWRQDVLDAPCKRPLEQCFVEGTLELFGGVHPSARLVAAHAVMRRAYDRLGRWEIADICQAAIEESGWLARLERAGNDGISVAANVLAAIRYIRELTTGLGLGVARAAGEFDQWLTIAKLTPKSLAGDKIDAVQVMTVHGSKGLQFAVTAVAECWGNPNMKGRLAVGVADGRRIVCLAPNPDFKGFTTMRRSLGVPEDASRCRNVAEWGLYLTDAHERADAAEKARLLYVALTRAEEALVVGIPLLASERYRSELAQKMLAALMDEGELEAGAFELTFEPARGIECEYRESGPDGERRIVRRRMDVAPALVRVVTLRQGAEKDDPWQAFSAGTLAGFDGELPEAASLIAQLGATGDVASQGAGTVAEPFSIFDIDRRDLATYGWRSREGIYSYTSMRAAQRAADRAEQGSVESVSEAAREAEGEGAAYTADVDKATALGSAFHALAQTMVETGSDHDPARLEALERIWGLSERQRTRLRAAVALWEGSELRREALSYPCVRAEVPFFVETPGSPYGDYVEGAIDLLATRGVACAGDALVIDYKTGDLGLDEGEVAASHEPQASLYAKALLSQGFDHVSCVFICVETGVEVRWDY